MERSSCVLSGLWSGPDRERIAYLYLPLEVPEDVRSMRVSYRTSLRNTTGGEHVDIGIFDPRGHAPGSAGGFRGWSGSARDHFAIGEAWATPGYIPGPLPPGTWHVVLGSESRRTGDVEYRVDAAFSDGDPPEAAAPGQAPFSEGVVRPGAGYYRGDLHCHTVHSDGAHLLETVAGRARDRGLEFLSITNHNVIATSADLPADFLETFLLIGGEEVTTYRGHLNVWGIRDWLEFRACTDGDMGRIVAAAHERGALTCINHPREGGPDWLFGYSADVPCLEVWNGPWPLNNHESVAVYDRLLCAGRRITAVGGSDIHVVSMPAAPYPYELGNPTTHVYATKLSERAVLDGLRSGRVCITADVGAQWAELRVEAEGQTAVMGEALAAGGEWRVTVDTRGLDDAVVMLIADGREVATVPVADAAELVIPAPAYYVRAQVLREAAADPGDWFALALTNPVYRANT